MGSCVPFSLGHPWPICLPWASSALLLTLCSHGFLTDFIGLPRPNYFILILGVHGPAINPLLSLLALLWACRDPFLLFFTSNTAHGFATHYFSFSSSFKLICSLKAHLLISWICDPLFLSLELNGFFLFFISCQLLCVVELGFLSYI